MKKYLKKIASIFVMTTMVAGVFTGCSGSSSSSSQGGNDKPIKIGSVHPLTGAYSYEAKAITNAQKIAIDEINKAGGIKSLGGRKLELEVGDSQGVADKGTSETERLINDGCVAVTGTFQSGVTLTAMQEAEKEQIPFVVTVSNNVSMFKKGFKYCFRIQPNANVFSNEFVDYIKQVKTDDIKTAVLIDEDSITGTESGDIIQKKLSEAGIKLVDRIKYSATTTTLSTEVTKIASDKPDMLITIGYFNDTSLLVREINSRNLKFKLVCGVANGGISDTKFISDFGSSVDNFVDLNYRWNPKNEAAQKLLSTYKSKYGSDMSVHAIYGYESIKVLADALQKAKSTDHDKLRDALSKTNYSGTILPQSGNIKFDSTGENVNASGVLVQIQNGKQVVVWPKKFAEADIKIGK